MIVKVEGDSGKEYTVDTTNVTCTCPGWIYSKKRHMIGDPERMCKHLRKVFDEKPESFPKVYLDALKAEEAASKEEDIQSSKTFSENELGVFTRNDFSLPVNTLKELIDLPGTKLVSTGSYRIGVPMINKATLMCGIDSSNYGKNLISDKNKSAMKLLGILDDYSENTNTVKFTFIPTGMKVVEVKIVPLNELLFQRLFDTGPKDDIVELINKSNIKGLKLTSSGFEGIPTSNFSDEKSIYDYLDLVYPFERSRYYDI